MRPIWTYSHPVQPVRGRPSTCSLPWTHAGHHLGKIAILTGKFIYILSASVRPADCNVSHYPLTGGGRYVPFRATMGSRHAIWTDGHSVKPFVGLQTCAYFTMPDSYVGLQRLGHVGQPGVQLRPLQLPIGWGEIIDISWDESSGRLCALLSRAYNGRRNPMNRILIVDLA